MWRDARRHRRDVRLRRLGTDHLDLYLLHWPGPHALEETLAGFRDLQDEGKIRAFGVSNLDAREQARFRELAGAERVACNQVLYHLEERAIEHRVIPEARDHGIPIVAYSPFGSGDFPSNSTPAGVRLHELADSLDLSARQLALAFLLRDPGVAVIPMSSRPEHVRDNCGAANIELEPEVLEELDRLFPRGAEPSSLPMI